MRPVVGEPFRFGRVVGRSFAIWWRELPLLLALALLVHAPRKAAEKGLMLLMPEPPRREAPPDGETAPGETAPDRVLGRIHALQRAAADSDRLRAWYKRAAPLLLAASLLGTLFTDLSIALVIFAVCARLRGRPAGFRESVRGGLRRTLPVLRVAFLLFLLRLALWLGASLAVVYLVFHAIGLVGHILLLWRVAAYSIVILLLSPFWVAAPAAVVEEPRRLLRRSWRLTRGHRIAVPAIVLLHYGFDWGSARLLRLVSADLPWLARTAVWWTQDLLAVSLAAVLAAVGYHALRLEKEGVDVSKLEEVFA
jgi:cell division protein FtsB